MKKNLIAIIMALALVLTLTPMAFVYGLDEGEGDGSISTSTRQLIEINGKTTDATMGKDGTVTVKVTLPTAEELKNANLNEDALNGVGSITVGLKFDNENLELTSVSVPGSVPVVDGATNTPSIATNIYAEENSQDQNIVAGETVDLTSLNSGGVITFNAITTYKSGEETVLSNVMNLTGLNVITATFKIRDGKTPTDEVIKNGTATYKFEFTGEVGSTLGTSKGFEIASSESKTAAGGDGAEATTQQTKYLATLEGDENIPTLFKVATSNTVKVVAGFDVSGTVTSYGSASNDLTITLTGESGATISTLTKEEVSSSGNCHTQAYTFTGVPSGKYTLKVEKQNHVAREYTINVNSGEVKQDATINLLGDVNLSGTVDVLDLQRLYEHLNGTKLFTDSYVMQLGDVNKSTAIDVLDLQRLYEHLNGTKPLFTT